MSPYDNNSPVLSERRGEPGSLGSEQLFPGQYSLVGQVAGWSREPGADTWGTKGELLASDSQLEIIGCLISTLFTLSTLVSLFLHQIFSLLLPSDTISEEHANIWGTWHTTLKPILKDQQFTGKQFIAPAGSLMIFFLSSV